MRLGDKWMSYKQGEILKRLGMQRVFHCNACGKDTIIRKDLVGDMKSVYCIHCGYEIKGYVGQK